MHTTNQTTYMAVLSAYGTSSEPSREHDGEYVYLTHYGLDGEEIAFTTFRAGQPISWHVADHTVL